MPRARRRTLKESEGEPARFMATTDIEFDSEAENYFKPAVQVEDTAKARRSNETGVGAMSTTGASSTKHKARSQKLNGNCASGHRRQDCQDTRRCPNETAASKEKSSTDPSQNHRRSSSATAPASSSEDAMQQNHIAPGGEKTLTSQGSSGGEKTLKSQGSSRIAQESFNADDPPAICDELAVLRRQERQLRRRGLDGVEIRRDLDGMVGSPRVRGEVVPVQANDPGLSSLVV